NMKKTVMMTAASTIAVPLSDLFCSGSIPVILLLSKNQKSVETTEGPNQSAPTGCQGHYRPAASLEKTPVTELAIPIPKLRTAIATSTSMTAYSTVVTPFWSLLASET